MFWCLCFAVFHQTSQQNDVINSKLVNWKRIEKNEQSENVHKLVGIDFVMLQIADQRSGRIDNWFLKRQLLLALILIEQKFTLDFVQIWSTSTNIDDDVVVVAAVIMNL